DRGRRRRRDAARHRRAVPTSFGRVRRADPAHSRRHRRRDGLTHHPPPTTERTDRRSAMSTVDTVVIGAGHAGLATSRLLTQAGRDHVVLERGRIGERWRSERWDSLRLLTPNWLLALPGSRYGGPDPDGFARRSTFVGMLEEYAASFAAPVVEGTTVEEVRA